jgi:hypothetical protein
LPSAIAGTVASTTPAVVAVAVAGRRISTSRYASRAREGSFSRSSTFFPAFAFKRANVS